MTKSILTKPNGSTWRFRIRHGDVGRWRVVVSYAPSKEAAEASIRQEWPHSTVFFIDEAMNKQMLEEERSRLRTKFNRWKRH